jgi:hypothetical protein
MMSKQEMEKKLKEFLQQLSPHDREVLVQSLLLYHAMIEDLLPKITEELQTKGTINSGYH